MGGSTCYGRRVQLTVVGSADAFNSLGRSHSCYLVRADGAGTVMVDFGATALAALRRLPVEPNDIDGFAITHLHGDHIGGFPFLLIDCMFNVIRRRPLDVVGPVLSEERIHQHLAAAYGSVFDRPRSFEMRVRELEPGRECALAGMQVRAFPAEHMDPPDQPLCLRLTSPAGRSIAFSGDTEICEGLFAAADGADLLVAECTALAPPAGRHSTWSEWKQAFAKLRSRRVLLTHLGREVREAIPALLREAPAGVQLAFADDGMIVDV